MDIEKQLEVAAQSNHLVLVVFYADWSPHYEWIGPVLRTYEQRVIELVNVNIEGDKAVADSYNIETVPAFLLLHKGHELWRQVGIGRFQIASIGILCKKHHHAYWFTA